MRPSRVAHKRTVGAEAAAMSCARAISGMSSNDSNANRATRRTLATLPHSITVPRRAGLTSSLLRREEYAEMMAWRHALVGCLLLVAACGVPELPGQAPTSTVPAPTATAVPKRPEDAANAFFSAWQQSQFSAMYELLSAEAQATTAKDVFLRRYTNIRDGIGEIKLTIVVSGPPV